MVQINPLVLVYLVQVVDERLLTLKREVSIRDADDEALPGYEDELMTCSDAAMELERCYQQALLTVGNMPVYADLVRQTS